MSITAALLAAIFAMQANPAQPADNAAAASPQQEAQAPAKPADAEQAKEAEEDDPGRMICKKETIAGSRLRHRETCKTARGWEEYRNETRNSLDRATSRYSATPI
jgi:hypothetical protein